MGKRKKKNEFLESEDKVDLTPMIDIVFLLLAYFMVTTTIIKEEGQLGINMPSDSPSTSDAPPPIEAVIFIRQDNNIEINGQQVDDYESHEMPQLTEMLTRLKQTATGQGLDLLVTVQAHEDSKHQRAMDAINACAKADIEMLTFGAN